MYQRRFHARKFSTLSAQIIKWVIVMAGEHIEKSFRGGTILFFLYVIFQSFQNIVSNCSSQGFLLSVKGIALVK